VVVCIKGASRPFGIEQVRPLTHTTTTRERRSYPGAADKTGHNGKRVLQGPADPRRGPGWARPALWSGQHGAGTRRPCPAPSAVGRWPLFVPLTSNLAPAVQKPASEPVPSPADALQVASGQTTRQPTPDQPGRARVRPVRADASPRVTFPTDAPVTAGRGALPGPPGHHWSHQQPPTRRGKRLPAGPLMAWRSARCLQQPPQVLRLRSSPRPRGSPTTRPMGEPRKSQPRPRTCQAGPPAPQTSCLRHLVLHLSIPRPRIHSRRAQSGPRAAQPGRQHPATRPASRSPPRNTTRLAERHTATRPALAKETHWPRPLRGIPIAASFPGRDSAGQGSNLFDPEGTRSALDAHCVD
jgi:hypothetical protein